MTQFWERWILAGICVFAHTASALSGLALISDIHAHYGNVETLMRQFAYARHHLLEQDPNATLFATFNGDNGGMSAFSNHWGDNGALIYRMTRVMASHPRVQLVMGVGNHDAFDEEGAEGNAAFLQQTRDLAREMTALKGVPFRVVNTNLHLVGEGKELIAPYVDFETPAGRMRFVGFVLDEFFKKCGYSFKEGPQFFTGLTPALKLAESVIAQAARDGVRVLVPMHHDYFDRVASLKAALESANGVLPLNQQMHIPWALGAHDHIQRYDRDVGVLDAGSNGSMIFSTIQDDGTPGPVEVYRPDRTFGPTNAPWDTDAYLTAEEKAFLAEEVPRIELTRKALATVVGRAPAFFARKALVKKGPEASGIFLADTLHLWASTVSPLKPVAARRRGDVRAIVGFWNSSSMRSDEDIPKGADITLEKLYAMHSMGRSPRRGDLSGAILTELYRTARRERWIQDRTFTPQLSTNFREKRDRNGNLRLEYFDEAEERWSLVWPNDQFRLVVDGFLAVDGYGIPGWKELLAQVKWIPESTRLRQRDILREYGPKLLLPPDCGKIIAGGSPLLIPGGNALERPTAHF